MLCGRANCAACCGITCTAFDNATACVLGASGAHPHQSQDGVCWPLAGESVSCPAQPEAHARCSAPTDTLYVSGSCHSVIAGTITWTSPTHLAVAGRLPLGTEASTVRGACPLVVADNIVVANVTLRCESGEAAIDVVGPNVVIEGVAAINASLFRAAAVKGVDVANLAVSGSTSTEETLGVLGHTEGDWRVACVDGATVVAQTLSGKGTTVNCTTFDVFALLGVVGRRYEVDLLYKDAGVDTEAALYLSVNHILFALVAVLGVLLFLVHRQDLYRVYKKAKRE